MFKELLPIGSVVILRGGFKKLMITGIKVAIEENPSMFYDYIGVFYPEGFIGEKSNFLFNHGDINDVVFVGYNNPERESFLQYMEEEYQKDEYKVISSEQEAAINKDIEDKHD